MSDGKTAAGDARHLSLSYCGRFLTFAGAQIIQPGAANTPLLLHLDLRDARRVQRKNSLHTFTVGDSAHSKCFIQPSAFAPNYDSAKYLDSLFVAFYHAGLNANGVAHLKRVGAIFLLLFLKGTYVLFQKLLLAVAPRNARRQETFRAGKGRKAYVPRAGR